MNTLAKPIAKPTTKLIANVHVKTSPAVVKLTKSTPKSITRVTPKSNPGPSRSPASGQAQAPSLIPKIAIIPNKSFGRTTFWVTVGKSTDGVHCCVCVEKKQSENVIRPVNDRKYIATNVFQFDAGNKIVLSCIMTNLCSMGIWPNGKECNFNPPVNPDNIFYTSLLISDMPLIANTIRSTIAGITIGVGIGTELVVSEFDLAQLIQVESPNILLEQPFAYIIRPHGNSPNIVAHSIGKNKQDIAPSY